MTKEVYRGVKSDQNTINEMKKSDAEWVKRHPSSQNLKEFYNDKEEKKTFGWSEV